MKRQDTKRSNLARVQNGVKLRDWHLLLDDNKRLSEENWNWKWKFEFNLASSFFSLGHKKTFRRNFCRTNPAGNRLKWPTFLKKNADVIKILINFHFQFLKKKILIRFWTKKWNCELFLLTMSIYICGVVKSFGWKY